MIRRISNYQDVKQTATDQCSYLIQFEGWIRMEKSRRIETLLWSIAFPGFGQIINGQFLKGLLFIGLELFINTQSNLNLIILLSFHGRTAEAIAQTNFEWLMFYPCIYMFAMWDAYKQGGEGDASISVYPFIFGAYFGTVGIIYSKYRAVSFSLGPVWLGIIGLFIGLMTGFVIHNYVGHSSKK